MAIQIIVTLSVLAFLSGLHATCLEIGSIAVVASVRVTESSMMMGGLWQAVGRLNCWMEGGMTVSDIATQLQADQLNIRSAVSSVCDHLGRAAKVTTLG